MSKHVFTADGRTTMKTENPFSPVWPGLVIGVIILVATVAPIALHRPVRDQVADGLPRGELPQLHDGPLLVVEGPPRGP